MYKDETLHLFRRILPFFSCGNGVKRVKLDLVQRCLKPYLEELGKHFFLGEDRRFFFLFIVHFYG